MAAITTSDVRKPFVVAEMKKRLNTTKITCVTYDAKADSFTGHATWLNQDITIPASEIPNLPVVEKKAAPVAKFAATEAEAAVIAFVTAKVTERAERYRIHTCWLEDRPHSKADNYSDTPTLRWAVGSYNSEIAEHLGFTQAKTLTLLKRMVEAGKLNGGKGHNGFTVIVADPTFLAKVTQIILTNPRLS